MKPFMLIQGSSQSIETFEQKVASAIEAGYCLAGEMIAHPVSATEMKFYQSMILQDDEDEFEDEEDEEELESIEEEN
jgi:hypothetical protein